MKRLMMDDSITAKAMLRRVADMEKKLDQTESQLKAVLSTDPLTGLDNREQCYKRLRRCIQKAHGRRYRFALLLLNIDHFKRINDYFGYQIGDLLLKEVVRRLKQCVGEQDGLARLSGDEFAIITNQVAKLQVVSLFAQRILNALKAPYCLNGKLIYISITIGVASYPLSGKTMQQLMQRADLALSDAKAVGRSYFEYDAASHSEMHHRRYFLENALYSALKNEEFEMHYQPIFQLKTRRIVGVEALMRWHHPRQGWIAPESFIPIAEETGLIAEIGQWGFEEACKQVHGWHEQGFSTLRLAVNLSPRQLLEANLLPCLIDTLEAIAFPPSLLELELTESSVLCLSKSIETLMKAFAEQHVHVALDDFGTGFSSLSHLKQFPISTVKIDKSFLSDVTQKSPSSWIVKAILTLSQALELNVIAEGIETMAQLQFLLDHQCPEGQGFYFSKPLNSDRMRALLLARADENKAC